MGGVRLGSLYEGKGGRVHSAHAMYTSQGRHMIQGGYYCVHTRKGSVARLHFIEVSVVA